MNDYQSFLAAKRQLSGDYGFDPVFMPDAAFDFQRKLIEWSCRKGRSAIFADCGMGKTLVQLAWAENVVRKTNGRVLILTPLAVSHQTVTEALKFGIEAARSNAGELPAKIVVTNYERLHHFHAHDFEGVVADESSILKNFGGARRKEITAFMQNVKFRLLCTATAAPNDFMELGSSSEALGVMKHREMLSSFFTHDGGDTSKWTLKGHASNGKFWEWMCSWAVAVRSPSDLGCDDSMFILPELVIRRHIVSSPTPQDGFLFTMPAIGLEEQRAERRSTINQRCEMAAQLVAEGSDSAVSWCHLNAEGNLMEKLIPGAVQVAGSDSDEKKEELFRAFESGEARVMVTKPSIAGFGLNWYHCARQTFFPSHSFEQWYQCIRRCWRFGQKRPVLVDVISSEGEADVVENLQRKADNADLMFSQIVHHMSAKSSSKRSPKNTKQLKAPSWK